MRYFVIIMTLSLVLKANINAFELLSPLPNNIVSESYVSVVIKVNSQLKNTQINIRSENISEIVLVDSKRDVYCKTIKVREGENSIDIDLIENGKITQTKKVKVFYNEDLYATGEKLPIDFRKHFFHQPKQEALCKKCHKMDEQPRKEIVREKINVKAPGINLVDILKNPEESNCFECHKKLISKKNAHAPSVNLICTECHTGNAGEFNTNVKGQSRFLQPDPISNRCFSCHENVESEWLSQKFKHGPAMDGRCTRCHNPHSSEEIFFTKKPIWDLCTTCHSEKAVEKHVVSSFVFGRNKGAHPTKGPKDPAREGRELVCSSCHNPHGSNGKYLLRMDGEKPFEVCKRCHTK